MSQVPQGLSSTHEIEDHLDEPRITPRGGGTDQANSPLGGHPGCLPVEVVHDLHVIRGETEWDHDRRVGAGRQCYQGFPHVGSEPRL